MHIFLHHFHFDFIQVFSCFIGAWFKLLSGFDFTTRILQKNAGFPQLGGFRGAGESDPWKPPRTVFRGKEAKIRIYMYIYVYICIYRGTHKHTLTHARVPSKFCRSLLNWIRVVWGNLDKSQQKVAVEKVLYNDLATHVMIWRFMYRYTNSNICKIHYCQSMNH